MTGLIIKQDGKVCKQKEGRMQEKTICENHYEYVKNPGAAEGQTPGRL